MKFMFTSLFVVMISLTGLHAQFWEARDAGFSISLFGGTVYAIDESVGWCWGWEEDEFFNYTFLNSTISRTTDGGESWQSVTYPTTETSDISSICALDASTAWLTVVELIGGAVSGNAVYKTTDGGLSWSPVNIEVEVFVNFIYMWNTLEGIVLGDPDDEGFEAYRTIDGGVTWNRIQNIPPAPSDEYIWGDNYAVVGDQLWFATSFGRIYHTEDKGENWDAWDSPNSDRDPWKMDVSDEGDVYLITADWVDATMNNTMALWRTSDAGTTWVDVTPSGNDHFPLDLSVVPGSGVVVSTFSVLSTEQLNLTRISVDKGASWMVVDTATMVYYLDFYSPEVGYGSDQNFGHDPRPTQIYRYNGSPLSGLFKNTPLLDIKLTIAPNPTIDHVDISLIAETPGDYWILLNDLSGSLISKYEFKAVTDIHHRLDMKPLPAGTYSMTILHQDGIRTEKIIKQ